MSSVSVRVLSGFDDERCSPARWEGLLTRGETNVIFLTRQWLRAWWETIGEGNLLLLAAERQGELVALAPFYHLGGVVFFLGEGDYADFIGDVGDGEILAALLAAARSHVRDFAGFRLCLVPGSSRTGACLERVAGQVGLTFVMHRDYPAVEMDLAGEPDAARDAVSRSMLKREEYLLRNGALEIRRMRDVGSIRGHLDEFFAQHLARWDVKADPSPFADPRQRAFLERFLELAEGSGWVRFLRIDWRGRPLAFEFAWYYRNVHYSGPWCFAIREANRSPGHVLLRQSILAALAEGLHTYDLGGGDQEYKLRLPVRIKRCHTWGLYP
jgi:CelD/BcsL family acetyltransferase involved in cellulose biosynthesis